MEPGWDPHLHPGVVDGPVRAHRPKPREKTRGRLKHVFVFRKKSKFHT